MKMRKIISLLLALVMVCSIIPMAVFAEGEATTVTVSVADYATAKNWSNGTQYASMEMDDVIAVTLTGGSNTGKYYDSDNTWRVYQNENPSITVAANGSTILSVKITYSTKDSGIMTLNGENISSGTVVSVNAASVTFGVGNTGNGNKGKVNITDIMVTYGEAGAPCVHEYINEYDATCEKCANGDREVTLPEAFSVITFEQAQKLYDAGVTDTIYKVTGVITEVYNATYGNMYIADEDGNEFIIYGLYSADGTVRYDAMETKPIADDTITVSGKLTAYKGVAQMSSAWLVSHTPAERETCTEHVYTNEYDATCNNAGCTTGNREVTLPEADSTLTIEQANALGVSKDHSTYTEGKYYVTGIISEVYNDTYGNMYIIDEDGNVLHVYGTYDADGTNRYDAMEVKPVAGDTVKVYGVIGQYEGKPQMKNAWIVEHTPAETEDDDTSGDTSAGTGDFGFIALVSLMAVSGTALVVLKKKEF